MKEIREAIQYFKHIKRHPHLDTALSALKTIQFLLIDKGIDSWTTMIIKDKFAEYQKES